MLDRPRGQAKLLPNLRVGKTMTAPQQTFDFAFGKAMADEGPFVFNHLTFQVTLARKKNESQ
jgi:hypothetical protein